MISETKMEQRKMQQFLCDLGQLYVNKVYAIYVAYEIIPADSWKPHDDSAGQYLLFNVSQGIDPAALAIKIS